MKSEKIGSILVIDLNYDCLDATNVDLFMEEMVYVIQKEKKVVFDLQQLDFVDSSGLGALLSCSRRVKTNGGTLVLCGLSDIVRNLFELVRLHRVINIQTNREAAIEAFAHEE